MDKRIEKWINKNININLENKNVLITGSNSGIGFEEARLFSYFGSNVFLLVRNISKGEEAKKILEEEFGNNINIIKLDLADIHSIEDAVNEIKKIDVDIFVNNAGVFRLPKGVTKDNIEITMGTNYIGTLYLNDLLNEYFKTLNHNVNNIFTTSITSKISKIDYNDFYHDKSFRPLVMYARSKVAINNMYFNYLDEYKDSNLKFSLIHPGGTYTPLIKKGYRNKAFEFIASIFMKLVFHSPSKAALTALYALNHSMVGPKGLFEISGYPHETKYKRDVNYKMCVEIGRSKIKEVKK